MAESSTIFALSSGAGLAAVSVVRLSGPMAGDVVAKLAGGVPKPRMASRRLLVDPKDKSAIDEALVLWIPGPASFTGEDVAEFHVHGSRAVLARLLEVLSELEGCVLAAPGEFTRRAFENGKLDLLAVEGLADLIAADTEVQRKQAWFHKAGLASQVYADWRLQLVTALANLEAAIDFSDEAGVEDKAISLAFVALERVKAALLKEMGAGSSGERIRDGVRVVLAGPPNVGKSSLLNCLADRDVAIVSQIEGTTRDVIEVQMDLDGLPVVLIDTAGLRDSSDDEVERLGMARSVSQLERADITVWMQSVDVSQDTKIPDTDSATLRILNKTDLDHRYNVEDAYHAVISVKTQDGIDQFVDLLKRRVASVLGQSEPALITRARHRKAVQSCAGHIEQALERSSAPLELVAEDVRLAIRDLERLIGRVDVEDLLDVIFRDFCIGK